MSCIYIKQECGSKVRHPYEHFQLVFTLNTAGTMALHYMLYL